VKYALDTNIFIDGFRDEGAQTEILAFLNRALPFTYLSAVVMQELAAGARTAEAARDLQQAVFEPFERRGRVFVPSSAAFVNSGRVLARVAAREGWPLFDDNPSLLNDALIAASCREQGITLITKDQDFERIAPFLKGLRFVKPWPSPPSANG
jgi:predicted nucleic acid-binding protein